jgi:hypothetical protein
MPGKCCVDNIFTLCEIISYSTWKKKRAVIAFLDITGAYDSVVRPFLFQRLYDTGIARGRLWDLIVASYDEPLMKVKLNGRFSKPFMTSVGVRQGAVLSPLLFTIYLNDMLLDLNRCNVGIRSGSLLINNVEMADDIALITEQLDEMQLLLNVAGQSADRLGLTFSAKKSGIVIFTPAGVDADVSTNLLQLQDQPISFQRAYTYLGAPLDERFSLCDYFTHRLRTAERKFALLKYAGVLRLIPVQMRIAVYKAVQSSLTYASEVMVPFTGKDLPKEWESAQLRHFRTMLGIRFACPNAFTLGELGTMPLQQMVDRQALAYYARLYRMENSGLASRHLAQLVFRQMHAMSASNEGYTSKYLHYIQRKIRFYNVQDMSRMGVKAEWKKYIKERILSTWQSIWSAEMGSPHSSPCMKQYTSMRELSMNSGLQRYLRSSNFGVRLVLTLLRGQLFHGPVGMHMLKPCVLCGYSMASSVHIMLQCPGTCDKLKCMEQRINAIDDGWFAHWESLSNKRKLQYLLDFNQDAPIAIRNTFMEYIRDLYDVVHMFMS